MIGIGLVRYSENPESDSFRVEEGTRFAVLQISEQWLKVAVIDGR